MTIEEEIENLKARVKAMEIVWKEVLKIVTENTEE